MPVINDGTQRDLTSLADTLSDSFAQDPVMNWVIPRPQLYQEFFRLIIEGIYLPRGTVHRESQGRGAALWLPPGEVFELPPRLAMLTMMLKLIGSKGPAPLWRMHRQGALFTRHHPNEPHFYLQFIGCRRRDQGCGVGAALLKQGTRICDEHQMPAYLESSNIRNVPLYKRHGFEVVHQQTIPGGGPTAWFMWREPH